MKINLTGRRRATPLGSVILAVTSAATPRLLKFGLVGISGLLVNSAILVLLVQAGHLSPSIGEALATEVAILSNFALHDRWTFRGVRNSHRWFERAVRFNLAALGGLLITVAVLTVLSSRFHLFYLIANVFAVGAGCLCNYILSSRFAWGMTEGDPTALPSDEHVLDRSTVEAERDLVATGLGR